VSPETSTDLTTTEERIALLEGRLQRLEDEQAITQLIASYGPLVDSGSAEDVAAIWTEDGVYDVDELFMGSRADIEAMVGSPEHQGLIGRGCTHFLGPVHVRVEGDEAVAVCHSILLVHHEGRYLPVRSGANRWELRRTPQGWRTVHRTTRALDGRAEAHELLRRP
jgi:ketosteroid isomerase-like protein